jgi:D-alanyl-D-alanine carboxypeptidase (penicillin-binding protein 5/6)
MKRYSYTPRRNGRPLSRAIVPGAAVPHRALFAVFAAVALVVAIGFLTRDGGDLAAVTSCGTVPCVQEPLALGASATPGPRPSVTAVAQPTPVRSAYPAPEITALSAMVIEEPCAAPLYAFNENTRYPPASLVKMMTALVASKHADLDTIVTSPLDGFTVSEETDGTVMGVDLGERLSLRDLLYGLLLRSGNDAALIISQYVAGSEEDFVEMMNSEASALGLKNTHFTNSHGLDHVRLFMSARDAAILGHEVLKDPELAEIVAAASYTPDWGKGPLENINLFLSNYPGAIGVKTGFTPTANQTIVAAATQGGRTLTVSVMHSIADYEDASALLDWAFVSTEPACDP